MNKALPYFKQRLASIPQACYPHHSRVHGLRSFSFPSTQCYVKRDDELGFGISGSKIRKYRSLIPFLIATQVQEVVIIGSAYSNHVLSLAQLLIENGLRPTLFLRGDPKRPLQGNALLTSLFLPLSSMHWVSQINWKNVEQQAHAYAKRQQHSTFVLPEGGFCPEALPGALTLALDLLKNEEEENVIFDHIFIEAGTGFTASALLLGLEWLKHPACLHIILLADDEQTFISRLKQCHEMFDQFMQVPSTFPQKFTLHSPQKTRGFGQVNSSIFESIAFLARHEGFLTDPVYSAKLFIESRALITQEKMQGNILIHHAGGALTLLGFQNQLQKLTHFK